MQSLHDHFRFGRTVFQSRVPASDSGEKDGGDRDENLSSGGAQFIQFFGRGLDRGVDFRYVV